MTKDSSSHVAPNVGDVVPADEQREAADASQSDVHSTPPGESHRTGEEHADEQPSTMPPAPELPSPLDSQKTVISKRPPVSPPAFRRAASPFEMGQSLEGEKLGHFLLEEFVGGGGMGAVFRATDTMLGRTVAVKVVARDQTNEDTLRRFKNEAQSAARLDHPNIARVYYVGEDQGWNYIVFEYIEGVNVRDLVEHNGVLAIDDAISYTLQIAEALEHASQRDVTHRDIKPSNILIMIDGRAKLVDMGLARLQQVESSTDDLTASGVTLGTFDYISPEQARDPRNTDVRSDLYSLGCTLYYMLTGQPPFPDGTVLQKLLSHSSDVPPELRQLRPDVDEEVSRIVRRLLAKQPEQRYQSPRELIGELLLVAERLNLSGIRTHSTILLATNGAGRSRWIEHLPWIVPVALLLLVVSVCLWIDSLPDPPIGSVPSPPRSVEHRKATLSANRRPSPPITPVAPAESPAVVEPATTSRPVGAPGNSATESGKPQPAVATPPKRSLDASGAGPAVVPTPPEETKADDRTPPAATPQEPLKRSLPVGPGDNSTASGTTGNRTVEGTPRNPATPATANGSTAALPGAPSVENSIRARVIVSDEKMEVSPGMVAVSTLNEALRQAAQLEGPAEIELRFDGVKLLEPLTINANEFAEKKLTIRAAAGFSPIIVFRPTRTTSDDRGTPPITSMIEVLGGHFSWQGTQFYLEVPERAEQRERWSLFRLDTIDRVEFRQCSFTIRSVDALGVAAGRNVSFVDLVGPGDLGGMIFGSAPLMGDTPAIWLEDCVARGQATFVSAEYAVPFSFSWENGLFISTQQLFDIGGMFVEPRWEHGAIKIWLQRLLAVTDQGIGLMRSDTVAPYQLNVSINCDYCLIAARAASPVVPLYTLRSNLATTPDTMPLIIGGNNNYYKNTNVVLRVESSSGRDAIEQYTFDDLKQTPSRPWYTEKSPLPATMATMFSWTPPAHSADRQSLYDFIPPGIGDGWFTRALGITPSQLPRLPEFDNLLPSPSADGSPTPARTPSPDANNAPEPTTGPSKPDGSTAQPAPGPSTGAQAPKTPDTPVPSPSILPDIDTTPATANEKELPDAQVPPKSGDPGGKSANRQSSRRFETSAW